MIITGFTNDANGNRCVNIANDNLTAKFKIQINQPGFNQTRSINNCHSYKWTDKQKELMENEIRAYIRKFGTKKQKLIVDYI